MGGDDTAFLRQASIAAMQALVTAYKREAYPVTPRNIAQEAVYIARKLQDELRGEPDDLVDLDE